MLQSAEDVIHQFLDPGEQLLWSGQPRGGIRFRWQDWFLIPFSLVWGGGMLFGFGAALVEGVRGLDHTLLFPGVILIPIAAVVFYVVFGRFIVDAKGRERTYYGVTNERVVIIRGLLRQQIKSLQLRALQEVSMSKRSDGSGTITFGQPPFFGGFAMGGSWPGSGRFAPPSFEMIERAKEVYDIIRNAQRSA